MRIKTLNPILLIDILSVLLIFSIAFIPYTPARVVLGLPFLLFFPGYTLVAAIFAKTDTMNVLERAGLGAGLSVAIVGLIGFGLNFTPWGIRLVPVLCSVGAFIYVTSMIALVRVGGPPGLSRFVTELNIGFPLLVGSKLNRSVSLILIAATVLGLGTLAYSLATASSRNEKFSEFYVLGINGKAENYPTEFIMNNQKITAVLYGNGIVQTTGGPGAITLGVVNHEKERVVYSIKATIDGEPAQLYLGGKAMSTLGDIELREGQRWENAIGIAPQHQGTNQEVELLLFKGTDTTAEQSLHFWITVQAGG